MKYSQPYGISDPDAAYINGNPQLGIQGSIPPASAFEEPQRELVNFIINSDFAPDEGDLYQLTKAVRSQFVNAVIDTSAVANTLTCAMVPPLDSYSLGLPIRVIAAHANTGNTTINAGPGLVQIVRADGSVLQAGDIKAGGVCNLVFDGTRFQLINFLGAVSGGSNTYNIKIPYVADTSVTPNLITAAFSPAITEVLAGDPILVKLANNITGATTINVNALSNAPVTRPDTSALTTGDAVAGQIMLMVWDGTRWQFLNPRYASLETGFQIYAAAGVYTFTVPAKVFRLNRVRLWGAGGGGGSGYPYGSTGPTGGGGGAGGGYAELKNLNVVPGQQITVTIGAGGVGRGSGVWATGGTGGTSSFGAYMSATGGQGGTSGYPSSEGFGGYAGIGSGGDVNYPGENGRTSNFSTPAISASKGGDGGAAAMIGISNIQEVYSNAWATLTGGQGGGGGAAVVTGGSYYSYAGSSGNAGRCEIEWRV